MNPAFWKGNTTNVCGLSIHIPTIREIQGDSEDIFDTKDEQEYYRVLGLFAETPASQMVELNDIGVNYMEVSDFEMFLCLMKSFEDKDLLNKKSLLFFNNLRLGDMEVFIQKDGTAILGNPISGAYIDEQIYNRISKLFCDMNNIEKETCKVLSEESRQYFLEQKRLERMLQSKRQAKEYTSSLNSYIVALVNDESFSETYDSVRDMTIGRFNLSLMQIQGRYQVDNLNRGIYSGSISSSKIDPEKMSWLYINK